MHAYARGEAMPFARRAALALVVCALLGCTRPQERPPTTETPAVTPPALTKVLLGTSNTIADTAIFVGIEKRFFEEQGVEVERVNLGTAETAIPALAAEQIQV